MAYATIEVFANDRKLTEVSTDLPAGSAKVKVKRDGQQIRVDLTFPEPATAKART